MTRTEHVGVGSGWRFRLIVRDGKPLLYAHGSEGGWIRVDRADATDRAWLRSSRWTPPLPEGVRWPVTYALHQGDCLEVLRTLPDASVDAVPMTFQ